MLSERKSHINFEIKSRLPEFIRQQIKFDKRDIVPVFYTGCDFFEISAPGSYAVWVQDLCFAGYMGKDIIVFLFLFHTEPIPVCPDSIGIDGSAEGEQAYHFAHGLSFRVEGRVV